ncbi:MAG: lysophospholipid acyltransferase family protein [Myxococcales bacterium]
MSLLQRARAFKLMSEVAVLSGGYHLVKVVGNFIDAEEGVIEHRVSQLLSRRLLRHAGLEVEVTGAEHVEGLERYAVVCSHASYIDWALLLGYFPAPLRFIAKRELTHLPFVGSFLRLRGVLIDRRAGRGAKEAIAAASKDGKSWPILLFAEGTRTPDGKLQPFKKSGLRILAEAGRALLPVRIHGTFESMPRHTLAVIPGRLRLCIGEPVFPTPETIEESMAEVERRVAAL